MDSIIMGCLFGLPLQSSEPIWQNPRPLLRVQEVEVGGVGALGVEVVATGVAVGVVGVASRAAIVTAVEGVGAVTETVGATTNRRGHPAGMGVVVQCGTVPLSRPTPAAAVMEGVIFIHGGMTAEVLVGLVTISTGMTAEAMVVVVTTIAGMTTAKVVAVITTAEMMEVRIEAMEAAAAVADTNLIRSVFTMRKFKLFFHFRLVDCIS